ncbi:MAG: DUF2784 family protein [Chloroflexi bacterium]|nr:DUF2784 family protein [Chloroflexota bacterium]
MNGYWLAANVVLGLHMAVLAGVSIGVVVAALGILHRYPRLALVFWVTLLVTAISQPLPSCALTDMERWLRHRVEPEWDRTVSVQRMLIRELTGADVPERVFWWVGVVLVVVAGYAFWRFHRDQAGDMVGRLRRG